MPTLDLQVSAPTDDILVKWTGAAWTVVADAGYQEVGYYDASNLKYGGGMRFINVTIPKGAIITTAYFSLNCRTSQAANTVNSIIYGEDVDDAATFSDLANYQGRCDFFTPGTGTTATADWDAIPAWTVDTWYDSPEIKAIIQEIIDRDGWESGNALALFWEDHAATGTQANNVYRQGYSRDNGAESAPKLHIEYTVPVAGRSYGFIIG